MGGIQPSGCCWPKALHDTSTSSDANLIWCDGPGPGPRGAGTKQGPADSPRHRRRLPLDPGRLPVARHVRTAGGGPDPAQPRSGAHRRRPCRLVRRERRSIGRSARRNLRLGARRRHRSGHRGLRRGLLRLQFHRRRRLVDSRGGIPTACAITAQPGPIRSLIASGKRPQGRRPG